MVGGQRSEVGKRQRSEVGGQRSEIRRQRTVKTEVRGRSADYADFTDDKQIEEFRPQLTEKHKGLIEAVRPYLHQLEDFGFYLAPDDKSLILKQGGGGVKKESFILK
ncbi:MAG: DUF3368 domain-containing protein [Desulfobacterales bacterium]|nr:DUF3368 domain-containing protein [Desulfobacterales bacterium]